MLVLPLVSHWFCASIRSKPPSMRRVRSANTASGKCRWLFALGLELFMILLLHFGSECLVAHSLKDSSVASLQAQEHENLSRTLFQWFQRFADQGSGHVH